MQRAFIIRPFGVKKDGAGKEIDFERVHNELIAPALDAAGLGGGTTGEIIEPGNIREDMFGLIIEADLIVCDITVHNANVFYELGIRHALRKTHTVLLKGMPVADAAPFDILTDRYLPYDVGDPASKKDDLVDVIRAALASNRDTDSPIFKMIPTLPEVDPATVQVIPMDLTEEVARATRAKAGGWLRLLASEVEGRRFQWPALRLIGQAQWGLSDFEGARRTWKQVQANTPEDIEANLALANLYERQYSNEKKPELLEASNQAIARVLNSRRTDVRQRAEALTLSGRNQKTLWRLDFETLDDLTARRERATNRGLLKAYEAYRKAYAVDLNHYWSGLAGLQLGAIALDLSRGDAWQDAFNTKAESDDYARRLSEDVEGLRPAVRLAIQSALDRLSDDSKDRVYVDISAADLMFLTGERERRVIKAYLDAVPKSALFPWNTARRQLQLFSRLGIRAELAEAVIQELDQHVDSPSETPDLHVIVFAGHRIDAPGRADRRFPTEAEPKARQLIGEALRGLQDGKSRVKVFASAAPGGDILLHEVCRELEIDSAICLPMPADEFGRFAFGDLDAWRARYLNLIGARPVLQLSDQEGLPRWLQETAIDPWQRGNRWVLEMAQTSGARTLSLIALWDSKDTGDAPGGTAHMVQIARNAGNIRIVPIDTHQLLS